MKRLLELARTFPDTHPFHALDAEQCAVLHEFADRLAPVHALLLAVVRPETQAAFDAENALFETDMQRYNKRMRRQPRRTAQAGL